MRSRDMHDPRGIDTPTEFLHVSATSFLTRSCSAVSSCHPQIEADGYACVRACSKSTLRSQARDWVRNSTPISQRPLAAHVAQEYEGLSRTFQCPLPDLGLERCEANNSPSEKVYADQKEDGSDHLTAVSPQETDDRGEVLVEVARRDR